MTIVGLPSFGHHTDATAVAVALRLKLGGRLLAKMLLNVLIDWLVGLIPLLGDLFDMAFKSNYRNAKLVAEAIREVRLHRDD